VVQASDLGFEALPLRMLERIIEQCISRIGPVFDSKIDSSLKFNSARDVRNNYEVAYKVKAFGIGFQVVLEKISFYSGKSNVRHVRKDGIRVPENPADCEDKGERVDTG